MKKNSDRLRRAVIAATVLSVAVIAAGWAGIQLEIRLREAELDRALEKRDEQRKAVRQVESLELLEQELSEITRIAGVRADPDGPVRAAAEIERAKPESLRIEELDLRTDPIIVRGWSSDPDTLADWLEKLNRSPLFSEPDLRELTSRPEFLGLSSARRGHSFTVLLPSASAEASGSDAVLTAQVSPVHGTRELRPEPVPSPIPPLTVATSLTHVPVRNLEVLGIYLTPSGPVARARSHGAVSWIRAGDLLQDGEVTWIGFFSERLAAVRLKRWVWPPQGGKPYREELRVVGWESLAEPRAPAREGRLQVIGREALGSWPEGRYSNPREALVVPGGREGSPGVDLFAAVFHELHGLLPWQHDSWRPGGWTVEPGFPWRGSIRGLVENETSGAPRRDPFRSFFEPWTLLRPFSRPGLRPGGLAGLLIDEIELEEIYLTAQGPVVEVASYGAFRPWTLRPGDKLADGSVVSVSTSVDHYSPRSREYCGEAVFQQLVDNPTALKPFREVVKRLRRPPRRTCLKGY